MIDAVKSQRVPSFLKKIFLIGITLACFILGLRLLISVFQSGYGYQFDTDELHHANLVYLYLHGYVPYRDIYNSFYTPLFEWLIAPAFMIFGFSFKTITFTRFIMIVLLTVRMIAMYVLIKTVWSRRTALFTLPLFLLDPFLVYSGMQIRPDNLMMTVFSLALAALAIGYNKRLPIYKYIAALLFGLSLVIFMKVIPALAVAAGVVIYEEIRAKRYKVLLSMVLISLIPLMLFAAYGLAVGALPEMYKQLIIEARADYSVWEYPVPFGFYNHPDNAFIYGVMGTPVTWVYVWILPLLGSAGLYHVAYSIITKKEKSSGIPLKILMVLLCITQLIVVFKVPSVFLQHYLPLNWIFALFGAVAIDDLIETTSVFPIAWYGIIILCMWAFTTLTLTSITYNTSRAAITNQNIINECETRWRQIPVSEPVFPGFLFRPSVYPVPYGYYIGNIPASVFTRLPSIADTLEKHQLKHLILDDYTLVRLPQDAQAYITSHYTRVAGDNALMGRNQ